LSGHYFRYLKPRQQLAVCLATLLLSGGCSATAQDRADGRVDKVTYLTAFGSFGREGFAYVAKAKGFFATRSGRALR
jgi:NitT/TauT family transport system substrate-binding protein